jgi:acetyl esterase/lipase
MCFLLAAAGGCSRFDLLNATVPHDGYLRTADLAYGPFPRQKLDLYQPDFGPGSSRASCDGPRGVVIFFYGGDWQTGKKFDYRFVAQALTSQGLIAVLPDYRLYPDVKFPTFVEDAAAIRAGYFSWGTRPGRISPRC